MHLFIFSENYDSHAIVVKAALQRLDVKVTRFISNNFPERAEISCSFGAIDEAVRIWQPDSAQIFDNGPVDVVWLRRPRHPSTSKVEVHPEDIKTVEVENREFWQAFLAFSFPAASWINSLNGSRNSRSKLLQLSLARTCGLTIPRTLVSNNPSDIRGFVTSSQQHGGVIAKSFYPVRWHEEGLTRMMYTAEVTPEQLPTDYLLRVLPAIYQEKISKSFEVRCTFFGRRGYHVKIVAEKDGKPLQDWREGHYTGMDIQPYSLPPAVEEKCLKLMDRLGIKFGCFDFIVTPSGDHVFLEVNEAGQFLWVESACPELRLLSGFCNFVLEEGKSSMGLAPRTNLELGNVSEWPEVKAALAADLNDYATG